MILIAASVATGLAKKLLTCSSRSAACATASATDRVGVPERDHGDARQEVEVALAVGVPQLGTAAALEHDCGAPNTGMNGH